MMIADGTVQVWGDAALAAMGLSDELTRATATVALVCLLGWAAWWLTGQDIAQRRRETLFPVERGRRERGRREVVRREVVRREVVRREVGRREVGRRRRGDAERGGSLRGRGLGGGGPLGSGQRGPGTLHLGGWKWRGTRPPPELLLLPLGLLASWPTHSLLVALAGAGAVVPAIRLRRRKREDRLREHRRTAVVGLCAALAGELRTGATPHQAVEMVAGEYLAEPVPMRASGFGRLAWLSPAGANQVVLDCTVLLAAVRFGGEVPEAFRALAELPGAEGAAGIAACWQVASSSGAGLAAGLDRVAEGLRAERALKETVRAELAGPRSTAALLAALPLFGLLLGAALGADPLRMLLHTPAGMACLSLGALLECAGLAWTGRIARGAETA
jgi:tight adherence protein B